MKPISLQLYTVRNLAAKDPVGVLKKVAEIGYKGVEGGASYCGRGPKEFRGLLDDLGLIASSVCGPIPTRANAQEAIENAQTLGCSLMMVGKGPKDFKTAESIRHVADELQAGAELVKGAGLRLCCHNHWWEFDRVDGRYGEEILLEAAPAAFAELDIYWAHNFGAVDVPAFVRRYKSRIPLMHVKDGPLIRGQAHTAVGRGKVNVPAIIGAADPQVLEWLVVELDDTDGDMMAAVADSYDYLTARKLAAGNK